MTYDRPNIQEGDFAGLAQVVPGDLITWRYLRINGEKSTALVLGPFIVDDHSIWSSLMNDWASLMPGSIVVAKYDESIVWLNNLGLFHSEIRDIVFQGFQLCEMS